MSDSLIELGERTLATALEATVAALGEGSATSDTGSVEVAGDPFAGIELPAVIADVVFDDGSVVALVLTHSGALRVAAALGAIDEEAAEFGSADLDDAALTAVGQLAHRIARSTSEGGQPRRAPARVAEADLDLRHGVTQGATAVRATLTVLGETVVVVHAVSAQAVRGIDDGNPVDAPHLAEMPLGAALHDIDVRVWAELGRTRMPTGQVVGLPSGAIVELDREAEDAVDLYVDGQLYAQGRLVVTDDDSWGVRVERVLGLR